MKICVIGTGYVGLVTGVCLADFGLDVVCVDKDSAKIALLNSGCTPICEPRLDDIIGRNMEAGRLSFTVEVKKAVQEASVIFVAVGTPSDDDGSANLKDIEKVAEEIAAYMNGHKVVVIKSTVPMGTVRRIGRIIHMNNTTHSFDIVSNPEFLREGSAVYDFMHPDKVVIGADSESAIAVMKEIYRPLYLIETPFIITTIETAETIKYACNCFLATKITYINEMANLCEMVGADIHSVAKAMGLDKRIGPKFLHPGPGYGGSCLPKDTYALRSFVMGKGYDFKILNAVIEANEHQVDVMVEKARRALKDFEGKTIGVLGLSFKQNTDDIRESPAVKIITLFVKHGAKVRCFDPLAMDNVKKVLPDIIYCKDEYETAQGCDALVVATEWNQFRNLDLEKIKELLESPILLDLRNLYDPTKVRKLGFTYDSVGRH
ncbi:MAG: UDP-glucose/GDP-mannose dehydrogenase family protein [candidate division WOR-3 bacterium]|nr:MAG: UDP-glucose/GDP-mannose dehydrogenase family protein [candidate division WOR-3 bacterium]